MRRAWIAVIAVGSIAFVALPAGAGVVRPTHLVAGTYSGSGQVVTSSQATVAAGAPAPASPLLGSQADQASTRRVTASFVVGADRDQLYKVALSHFGCGFEPPLRLPIYPTSGAAFPQLPVVGTGGRVTRTAQLRSDTSGVDLDLRVARVAAGVRDDSELHVAATFDAKGKGSLVVSWTESSKASGGTSQCRSVARAVLKATPSASR
jgi:hypothetical protein